MPIHIASQTALVFDHGGQLQKAASVAVRYEHAAVDGVGYIIGPKRQRPVPATTYHGCANRAAAVTLSATLRDTVGTAVAIDPTGSNETTGVFVEDCTTDIRAVAGLPSSATWIVIASWRIILPVDY